MDQEIEVKLVIDPDHIESLTALPMLNKLKIGDAVAKRMVSTYYDTRKYDLLGHDLSLRIRKTDGGFRQTVKGRGDRVAGLHRRIEEEYSLPENQLDWQRLEKSQFSGVFTCESIRGGLEPLFVTDFVREIWNLRLADGTQVELGLDKGEIIAGRKRRSIHEVELELKSGCLLSMLELTAEITQSVPVYLENISKAERGYALFRSPVWEAVGPSPLPAAETSTEAFKQALRGSIDHLQANERALVLGRNTDSLDQVWIAVRRLRAMLRACASYIDSKRFAYFERELSWLVASCGRAMDQRDILKMLSGASDRGAGNGYKRLAEAVAGSRPDALDQISGLLRSPRYSRVLFQLLVFLHQ